MKYFAVLREGGALSYMLLIEDVDPMAEALKSGPVVEVSEITEAEAKVIKDRNRVVPVEAKTPVQVDTVPRSEFEALKAQLETLALIQAETLKTIGGGNAV